MGSGGSESRAAGGKKGGEEGEGVVGSGGSDSAGGKRGGGEGEGVVGSAGGSGSSARGELRRGGEGEGVVKEGGLGVAGMVGVPGAVMMAIDVEMIRPMEAWLAAFQAAKVR